MLKAGILLCALVTRFECGKSRIGSVQKQFGLFALRHRGWSGPSSLPPYEARLSLLNMDRLRDRRTMVAFKLATKPLLENSAVRVNSPYFRLLAGRTRSTIVPHIRSLPPGRTRYEDILPLRRLIATFSQRCSCYNDNATAHTLNSWLRKSIALERRQRLSTRSYTSASGAMLQVLPPWGGLKFPLCIVRRQSISCSAILAYLVGHQQQIRIAADEMEQHLVGLVQFNF